MAGRDRAHRKVCTERHREAPQDGLPLRDGLGGEIALGEVLLEEDGQWRIVAGVLLGLAPVEEASTTARSVA